MSENKLILFSRMGCCLCEGLEIRLKKISLDNLNPPVKLCVRDVDAVNVPKLEKELYSLHVPVLIVELDRPVRRFELPRVSPRLSEEGLFNWLQKKMCEKLNKS